MPKEQNQHISILPQDRARRGQLGCSPQEVQRCGLIYLPCCTGKVPRRAPNLKETTCVSSKLVMAVPPTGKPSQLPSQSRKRPKQETRWLWVLRLLTKSTVPIKGWCPQQPRRVTRVWGLSVDSGLMTRHLAWYLPSKWVTANARIPPGRPYPFWHLTPPSRFCPASCLLFQLGDTSFCQGAS